MTIAEAYVALNLIPGIGPILVRQLLETFADPIAILNASASELARTSGVGAKKAEAIANWRNKVELEKELNLADTHRACIICRQDEHYPEALKQIKDPPLVLYVKGNVDALRRCAENGLAVVGSRQATLYGEKMTRQLVSSAVNAGWVIVSGLARGIDTIAHTATVQAKASTVAVTGGGLASIYPQENAALAEEICDAGCLVSEQPMTMKPDKRTFPMRNRIIAGLCPATLVVEAGFGSGSLITAERAFEQKRKVFAVPGRVDSPQSRGCNDLIKRGAKLVESLDDIQDTFTFLPGFGNDQAGTPPQRETVQPKPPAAPAVELNEAERRVVELLQAGEVGLDELVHHCAMPVHQMLSCLMGLELKRVVKQLPGKRFTIYN